MFAMYGIQRNNGRVRYTRHGGDYHLIGNGRKVPAAFSSKRSIVIVHFESSIAHKGRIFHGFSRRSKIGPCVTKFSFVSLKTTRGQAPAERGGKVGNVNKFMHDTFCATRRFTGKPRNITMKRQCDKHLERLECFAGILIAFEFCLKP